MFVDDIESLSISTNNLFNFLLQLYHIKGQVEEVETIESDVFQRFSKILDEFENSTNHRPSEGSGTSHLSPEDEKMFNKITDLIKVSFPSIKSKFRV